MYIICLATLERVDDVFAVGAKAAETIHALCRALGIAAPPLPAEPPREGEAFLWRKARGEKPEVVRPHPAVQKSERHTRKYAEGEFGGDKSFYFRGPPNLLNLRAQNLRLFLQIADGVDDETWLHHLRRHDYSRWMAAAIKDEELAEDVRRAEDEADPAASRRRVRDAIERRYTAPTDSSERSVS